MCWSRLHFDFHWAHTFTAEIPNDMKVSRKDFYLERISCWKSQLIPLPSGVYSVGRSKSANVIVRSKYCNRKHCRIIVDCESVSIFIEVSSWHDDSYARYMPQIEKWYIFSFVQETKSVGGVYVNDKRYRTGRILLKEDDKIGFGNPTDLSREVMARYGDQIHIYSVKSKIVSPSDSNIEKMPIDGNNKWVASSVRSKLLAPKRAPTPPKASSEADSCDERGDGGNCVANTSATQTESHVKKEFIIEAVRVTDNSLAGNERKCRFSNIVNFRLFDPEDPTDAFLGDWINSMNLQAM